MKTALLRSRASFRNLFRAFRAPAVLPALLFAALLSGCGMATTADWRRCSFDVSELAFRGLRENQAQWRVTVTAFNPNGKNLRIDGLHVWALLDNGPDAAADTLARLADPGRIVLAARDTTRIAFDVTVPHAAWNKALRQLRRTGSGEVLFTGDVVVPHLFGSRTVRNAIRERHTLDIASLLGLGTGTGDFLRGLFGR